MKRVLGTAALVGAALVRAGAAGPEVQRVEGLVTVRSIGTPLAGAAVAVECGEFRAGAVSDEAGRFAIELPQEAGRCTVAARLDGFRPLRRELAGGGTLTLDLEFSPVRETITVNESAAPVTVTAPEVGRTMGGGTLRELPSNGRNVNRFALLDPHIRNVAGLDSDGATAARLSINANSFRHTNYLLDGASNYDHIFANAPRQAIPLAAVQEFQTFTNQYSAERGGTTAGILSAVTRSGTDRFRGEAFLFGRPSGIQAAPPVSDRHVPNQRVQAGASLGGPLVRERTWYFGTYEKLTQRRGSFIQSAAPATFVGAMDEWYALAKVDHALSPNQTLHLRVNGNHGLNDNVNDRVGGFTQPSAAARSANQAAGGQVSLSSTWGRVANELRATYTNAVPSSSAPVAPGPVVVRPNYSTEGNATWSSVRSRTVQLADSVALQRGRHSVKAGAEFIRLKGTDSSHTPFGEYRFAPGPPKADEIPVQYQQTFGAALLRYGQTLAAGFVQDDWKVHPRLTANLGLRYEHQSITESRWNFAPRVGLAFDVFGNGNTVLRGGAGIFYDQYYLYIHRRFYLMGIDAPTASYTLAGGAAGFPAFPSSLTAPPPGAAAPSRDLYLPGRPLLNPYSAQFSLGLQQAAGDWVFSVDAVHSHTLRQMRAQDLNAPAAFARTAPGQRRSAVAADATRPFRNYAGVPVRNIVSVENSGSSLYDALDIGMSRRFAERFQMEAHYVWASATTYAMFFGEPNTGIPNDWGNTRSAERGPSDYHQRHRAVAHGLVDLPWGAQVSLTGTVASGLPVNPLTGVDNNGDTNLSDRPAGFGRNSFRSPMQASLDAAFAKRIVVREPVSVELRAEAFNVFNRNNYVKVNGTYGDGAAPLGTFLRPIAGVANSDPSRQFQFGLRVMF